MTTEVTVRLDVDLLWELIDRSWPHHIEGSGGSGDAQHTSWDVIDPGIPTREWVGRIVAEYQSCCCGRRSVPYLCPVHGVFQ